MVALVRRDITLTKYVDDPTSLQSRKSGAAVAGAFGVAEGGTRG